MLHVIISPRQRNLILPQNTPSSSPRGAALTFFIFCLEIAAFFFKTIIEFQSSVCVCVKKGNTSLKIYCMSVTVWAVLTLQRSRDRANRALLESVQTFTVFQIGAGAGEEILKSCIYNFCL